MLLDEPRHYYPIWSQIKSVGMCEISTHPAYHRRVIKAVIKEKYKDLGYKLECTESCPPIKPKMSVTTNGSVIKFTLHIYPLITLDMI
jgi:hypothetical protein